MRKHDWQKIETEYVTTDLSYANLSEKYHIHKSVIARQGRLGKWAEKKTAYAHELSTKCIQKAQEKKLSTYEQGMAALNEGWIGMCEYIREKIKQKDLEPIDVQRLANTYQILKAAEQGDKAASKITVEFMSEEMEQYAD